MKALTRINSNTPVKFDVMNALEAEIEARDNELAVERGYETTKVLNESDLNTIVANGKYKVTNTGSGSNMPDASTSSTWLLDVTIMNSTYVYQHTFCVYSNLGNTGKCYYRYRNNAGWSAWQELVTSTNSFMSYGYYNDDMNSLIKQGTYLCGNQATITNKPNTTTWGTINVFAGGTGSYIQEWVAADNMNKWYRHFNGASWGAWQKVATADLTEKVYTDAELLNGWTIVSGGTGVYLHKVGREVKFQAMITNTTQPTDVYILNIPGGFIPSKNVYFTVHNQKGEGATVGGGYVNASGYCYFTGSIPTQYAGNLEFHASWFTK